MAMAMAMAIAMAMATAIAMVMALAMPPPLDHPLPPMTLYSWILNKEYLTGWLADWLTDWVRHGKRSNLSADAFYQQSKNPQKIYL